MIIVEREAYPQEGVGKPDYTREISLGRERPGLTLKYNQALKSFGRSFSSINTGTHTAAPHPTIMTDAAAHFTINALIPLTILNVTDGSSGTIIANTETTVTVAALIGGIANQWNTGDAYAIPSPFAFITLPLAPGASAHMIDSETGDEMPFTVPKGYTMTIISGSFSFNQDAIIWAYYEGYLIANWGCPIGGNVFYIAQIVGQGGTGLFDPTGASSHPVDIQITNQGGANLEGGGALFCILAAVGTEPWPTTKTVKCKLCGHEETVPRETTQWICPKCGKLNLYYDLSRFKETT